MYILIPMEFAQCDQIKSVKSSQDTYHGVVRLRIVDRAAQPHQAALGIKERCAEKYQR